MLSRSVLLSLKKSCNKSRRQNEAVSTEASGRSEQLKIRYMSLEKRLHEAMAQHQKISSRADQNSKSLKEMLAIERVRELEAYAHKASSEIENAQRVIQVCEVRAAPSDDDFSQLLDRCTDLEAEKATIDYELKQHKNGTAEVEEITKESDELQEKLDAALAELVELQQMRDQDLILAHKSREKLEALVDANDELMMNSRNYWMKPSPLSGSPCRGRGA
ncbi:hypothetical protein IV203_015591 [Nitzschia inconspicua]|uniref:Uncharacterized protein n=1 Tax=Nitzschia inconspicua TaxID=303405 RepID=A0A9K3LB74_9STRA|nr:hypothetical protein IV203_015591 [Nitzschia inconspicua]